MPESTSITDDVRREEDGKMVGVRGWMLSRTPGPTNRALTDPQCLATPLFPLLEKTGEKAMEIQRERGPEGRGADLKQQQPQPQRWASRRLILRKSSAMATGSLKSRSTKMEWTR